MTPKMQFDLRNELQKELAKRNVLTRNSKKKALDMLNLTIESSVTVEISTPKTDNFDKRIQLRYQAIEEILKTERTFIERLDILIKYFVEPLKTLNLMDTQTHTSLFGQLELIYNINKELLNHLENDLSDVARGFIKMAPFFKLYSIFAFDYKNSLILLQVVIKYFKKTFINILYLASFLNFRTSQRKILLSESSLKLLRVGQKYKQSSTLC